MFQKFVDTSDEGEQQTVLKKLADSLRKTLRKGETGRVLIDIQIKDDDTEVVCAVSVPTRNIYGEGVSVPAAILAAYGLGGVGKVMAGVIAAVSGFGFVL